MKKFKYFLITFIIVVLDQFSKYAIRNWVDFGPGKIIKVTENFFWLTWVQNTGAAFSFSFGSEGLNRIIFIVVSLLAVGLISYYIIKSESKIEKYALSLVLGGAMGNLLDRIFIGSVTDFIWWDFPDIFMYRWPVFNIADSSIVAAIVLMIGYYIFIVKSDKTEGR